MTEIGTKETKMQRGHERGLAMVAMMVVMVMLLGIGVAIHTGVLADTAMRGAHGSSTAGFYAAEAGINRGMGDYRNIFLGYNVPSGSDFDQHTFTLGPRTVRYQLSSTGAPTNIQVAAGKQFAGLHAQEYKYTANATSEMHTGDVEASLGTEFDVDYIPLFQFLAFYAGDLEILPGKDMTLHGPIHTNGSLYLNATGSTLTVADLQPNIPTVHMSAAGDVIRRRKDDPASCTGVVKIAQLTDANHDGALDQLVMATCGIQSTSSLSNWLGSIKAHQPTVSVPTPDVIARGSGVFWQSADLRLVLNVAAPDAGRYPIVVQDSAGNVDAGKSAILKAFMQAKPGRIFYNDTPLAGKDNVVATCPSATANTYCNPASYVAGMTAAGLYACAGSDLALFGACANTVGNEALSGGNITARRGGLYNAREHAWVLMLNVNVRDLLAWNMGQAAGAQLFDPADTSDGGVVLFLSVAGAGSNGIPSPRYGVRVFGSPSLPFPAAADPTGLTVVSDQAVYVEGDYNTGGGGLIKQPAAVLGDTVNILSKGWSGTAACRNDCQSRQPLASRPATASAINAAFIAGIDQTTVGNYNGGLENYPRFLEEWTGRNLTYRGSFVSLGTPRHSNQPWCGTGAACDIYNPPNRLWDFDVDFQDITKIPPLTPRFVSVQQILFTENFR